LHISQDSSFGTKITRRDRRSTGRSSIRSRSKRFMSARKCPDRLWSPSSLLFNGYRTLFHGGKVGGASIWPVMSI